MLFWGYPHFVTPTEITHELHLLRDGLFAQLRPEPEERFIFQTLSLIVPFYAWGLTILAFRLDRIADQGWWLEGKKAQAISIILPLVVALILFYPFVDSDFFEVLLGLYQEYQFVTLVVPLATVAAMLGAIAWCVGMQCYEGKLRPARIRRVGRFARWATWGAFIGSVTLTILAWRLFGINRITLDQAWFVSMDAAVYALSQVTGGKTLLVDLPSQYGMFPEFLAPIFRVIGLSIFNVSAVFALMQALSLASVFAVLARYVKDLGLLSLSGLALISITFGTSTHSMGNEEVYFQYWPIRFFWPALSLWIFVRFLLSRTLIHSGLVSLTAAIGFLWNLETGLPIWVAFGGYLFFRFLGASLNISRATARASWHHTHYVKAGILHVGIVLMVGLLFFGLLRFKANGPINLDWMFLYPVVFYKLGFMMIPLPQYPHPWMTVLGLYLLGLLYAFRKWGQGRPGMRADVIGYLSFLGIGLFVYYQGRSHVLNLVSVCWPALTISAILADEALRMVRYRLAHAAYLALPVTAIAIFVLAACGFLYKIPSLLDEAEAAYRMRNHFASSMVQDEVSFIETNSHPGQQCLILSRRQGIYYIQTGLVSPVAGPGLIESTMKADDNTLSLAIEQGRLRCIFIGVGKYSKIELPLPLDHILLHYQVAKTNSGESMLYLVPRATRSPYQ